MGDNILKLLKGYEINLYVEDPGNFDKNLIRVIESYNTKKEKVISINDS